MSSTDKVVLLLLENSLPLRLVFKKLLHLSTSNKINIWSSSDAVQGLGYVFLLESDVIIVDTTLPKYGGLDVLDYISTNERLKRLKPKIIVLYDNKSFININLENYVFIKKGSTNFFQNLLKELKEVINKENDKSYKQEKQTKKLKILQHLGNRIIQFEDKSSRSLFQIADKKNLATRLVNAFKWIIYQSISTFFLTLFTIIGGANGLQENNIEQSKSDLKTLKVKYYPTFAIIASGVIIILIQSLFIGASMFSVLKHELVKTSAASYTWSGGGTDGSCGGNTGDGNKWSCAANWSTNVVPLATDLVTFDSNSVKDATVDAGFQGTLQSLTINTGYTGTITQERSLTVSSTFTANGGNYNATNQALTINGVFTMNTGAIFTASSTSTILGGSLTVNGGTFNHNSGTVVLSNSGAKILNCNNINFNLVSFSSTLATTTINANCNFPLGANPSFSNTGIITLYGIFTGSGTFSQSQSTLRMYGGSALVGFTGLSINSNASLEIQGANIDFSSYTTFDFPTTTNRITLASGTLTLPETTTLGAALILNQGTFNAPKVLNLLNGLGINNASFNANEGTINLLGDIENTITCGNAVFYLVTINTTRTKSFAPGCVIPLGNNPVVKIGANFTLDLKGKFTGTGTLTVTGGTFKLNPTTVLTGFTGLSVSSLNNVGLDIDYNIYSPFSINGNYTQSAGVSVWGIGTLNLINFTLSGGTLTSTSGIVSVSGNLNFTGSSIFYHNNGTLNFSNSVLSCNNVVFNLVTFTSPNNKTINSNCTIPVGDSPITAGTVNLYGTIKGNGTITFTGLNYHTGGTLIGFTGIVVNGNFLVNASTGNTFLDLSEYSSVIVKQSLNISTPSGSYTNTVKAPTNMILSALKISPGAVFNSNGGTLTFNQGSATITCGGSALNNVIVNLTANFNGISFLDNCTLNNLDINQGGVSNPATANTLSILGNLTKYSNANIGGANLTLAFVGNGTQNITNTAGVSLSKLLINTSGSVNLLSSFTTNTQTCTVTAGTFNLNGMNFTCSGGFSVANGATLQLVGNEISTVPTLNTGSNVKYVGNANGLANSYTLANWNYSNLIINSIDGALDSFNLNNNFTPATLTLTAGTIESSVGASTLVTSGLTTINGAVWNPGTLNITASGGIVCSSGILSAGASTISTNDLIIAGCNFTAPEGITTISGDFIHSSGNFNHNNGTINLTGNSKSVTGSTVFYNLYKSTSVADTLTFEANTTQTIDGTLKLNGASDNLLSLRSSITGTRYNVSAAVIDLSYLDIQDYSNTNGSLIQGLNLNITDSGNNTGWNLHNPLVNNVGPVNLTDGSFTINTTPELSFNISDLDLSDTLKYNIQIDNNFDFDSLEVDFTSTLDVGGDLTFSVSSPLAPGNYYWRVKALDASNGESSYFIANNGEIAFKEDFIPTISNLGSVPLIDGSYINTRQPTFNFTTADEDIDDSTQSIIQIDNNSDFSSPEIYYTFNQEAFGIKSFTVGQAADSGIYTIGIQDQNLEDGSYYWRVKTIDNHLAESEFTYANSSEIAFIVNSSPTVSELGPINIINGSYTTSRTPEFAFVTDDANIDDSIQFNIQIDNNLDFNSPEIDYLSDLLILGIQSFIPITELEDGGYYWRVKVIDNHLGESSYVVANSGEIAFNVNTVPVVTNLGPLELVNQSFSLDQTPTFNFDLSDVNVDNTISYEFQLSYNKDFDPLIIDYTSILGTAGTKTFEVGQIADGGIYTVGKEGQKLPSGNFLYYWRVKGTDSREGEGSYTIANDGDYGFGIDIISPTGMTNIEEVDHDNTNPYLIDLVISSDDNLSGVTHMQISDSLDFTNAVWIDYQDITRITLSSGSGTKNEYVKLRDKADNISEVLSASIVVIVQEPRTTSADQPNQTQVITDTVPTSETIKLYDLKIITIDRNDQPVNNVLLTLDSNSVSNTTDENGTTTFQNIAAGSHKIVIKYGKYTDEVTFIVGGEDKTINMRILLAIDQKENAFPYVYIILLFGIISIVAATFVVNKKAHDTKLHLILKSKIPKRSS